ncbi:MAG TPA: hypothetical protein VNO81_10030 [Candidatus Nitrosotenuis sp.]|jgi:hypothetical protein|nr:hypothetical protein [Candidatus Nitrosotenuis sp.]
MKLKTRDQLFEHACQLKDMKLSGFSPTTLKYHCTQCGGMLLLRLERQRWEAIFGARPSFKLSRKILDNLESIGISDLSEEDVPAVEMPSGSPLRPGKFHWEPSDEEDGEEEG